MAAARTACSRLLSADGFLKPAGAGRLRPPLSLRRLIGRAAPLPGAEGGAARAATRLPVENTFGDDESGLELTRLSGLSEGWMPTARMFPGDCELF